MASNRENSGQNQGAMKHSEDQSEQGSSNPAPSQILPHSRIVGRVVGAVCSDDENGNLASRPAWVSKPEVRRALPRLARAAEKRDAVALGAGC
jgi:hypothetical protein